MRRLTGHHWWVVDLSLSPYGKTLAVVSPINGDTIAAIPDCETADVDRAPATARRSVGKFSPA